MTQQDIIIH